MKSDYVTYALVAFAVAILFVSMLFAPVSDSTLSNEQSCPVGQTMTETNECVPLSFYD